MKSPACTPKPLPVDPKWIRGPADELAIREGCTFDADAGAHACDFIETFCRQSVGEDWAGKPLSLLPWQRDLIMRLFGWRRPDGRRRFKRAYVEVAKKNGKSTLVSALALYLLLCDDAAPQIFLNACDRGQARIVFDEAKRMVEASPALSSRLRPIDTRHRIVWEAGNGVIIANSADAPNKDGLNPSGVIFDELHRQPNADLWDVFAYAGRARKQPLTISITTAGEDDSGVWFEQRDYSEKVESGVIPDTTHLGVVYRADPEDDIDDPATWRKANPSLGVTFPEEAFRRDLDEAKETPRKLANFLRLSLNVISKSDVSFIPVEVWDLGRAAPRPSAGRGDDRCWMGLDLSKTTDLTALAILGGDMESGLDVLMRFWLPEDNLKELSRRDRVPYRLWADQGFLSTTPGSVVDYGFVRREIVDLAAACDLRRLLVDPANATKLNIELREEDGLPVEEIRQGFLSLSPPTKELERLALAGKLRHGGNPILRWNVANAVAETDAAGNVKLSKRKSRLKIDGAAALVNAIAAFLSDPDGAGSVYNERDLILL